MARRRVPDKALVEAMQDHVAAGRAFKAWAVVRRVTDRNGHTGCAFVAAFATKQSAEYNAELDEIVVRLACTPVAVYR